MSETKERAAARPKSTSRPSLRKVHELETQLAAKEARIREFAHRVKNSFAIIASLATLEAGRFSGGGCAESLGRIRGSVEAMALLYDRLAPGSEGDEVDAARYLEEICRLLAGPLERIELELDLEHLKLDHRRATALGLAANELATNAIKYAFAGGGRGGKLRVELKVRGGRARFSVTDDGPGFPPGFDPGRDGDFGLGLLSAEARELGGKLSLGAGSGARVAIDFPA